MQSITEYVYSNMYLLYTEKFIIIIIIDGFSM